MSQCQFDLDSLIQQGERITLREFSIRLIPPQEFITKAKERTKQLVKLLKSQTDYSIARISFAGSLGKKTSIRSSDVDCVLLLNNLEPPFTQVLGDYQRILTENKEELKIQESKVRERSVRIIFTNGLSLDLLPASNFVDSSPEEPLSKKEIAQKQLIEVQKRMTQDNHLFYSSSMTECQLLFMKQQSSFVHMLTRLGKFWLSTLSLGDEKQKIYGLKIMLELIAVAVGQKVEGDVARRASVYQELIQFLFFVARIDKLQLSFSIGVGVGNDAGVEGMGMGIHKADLRMVRDSQNLIIEPGNPFNNLALNFRGRETQLENLKKFALQTKQRLEGESGQDLNFVFGKQSAANSISES